jgi:hypothetical protein
MSLVAHDALKLETGRSYNLVRDGKEDDARECLSGGGGGSGGRGHRVSNDPER